MSLDGNNPRAKGFLEAHVWIILFAMVMSVLAAVAVFALRPTKYVATSSVLVQPQVINGAPTAPQMGTEAAIASSGSVLQRAADLLHQPVQVVHQGLSVSNPVDTTVLGIAFKAATPTAAFNGASAVTRAYVDYRNSGGDARVTQVITPATLPTGPSAVNYTLILAVALAAGFTIGIAASVVWDWTFGRAGAGAAPGRGQPGNGRPGNGRPDGQPRKEAAMDPWPRPRRTANSTRHESPSSDAGVKD